MKKKFGIAIGLIILIVPALIIYMAWPWILLNFRINSQPNPTLPQIQYGEFPIRLVYSINGETKVIEDTLICEFAGIGMNEGSGKYLKWSSRLASGESSILLLKLDSSTGIAYKDRITIKQEIYFDPGPAWYYMNDAAVGSNYEHSYTNASFKEEYQDGGGAEGIIEAEELFERFKIKLIKWEASPPIKNSFVEKE